MSKNAYRNISECFQMKSEPVFSLCYHQNRIIDKIITVNYNQNLLKFVVFIK